jgi:hypothetical protein
LSVTPLGSAPLSVNVGGGNPAAITVNDDANPEPNDMLAPLMIAGAWSTIRVKFCVALGNAPFTAVNEMG